MSSKQWHRISQVDKSYEFSAREELKVYARRTGAVAIVFVLAFIALTTYRLLGPGRQSWILPSLLMLIATATGLILISPRLTGMIRARTRREANDTGSGMFAATPYSRRAHIRHRVTTPAIAALGVLVTCALGVAVTLVTSDRTKLPTWLQPYHPWGWWAVLVLLLAAAILAAWQYGHQHSQPGSPTTVVGAGTGGVTAGRDMVIVGGLSPSAGGDIVTVFNQLSKPAPSAEVQWPTADRLVSNLPPRNPQFVGREDLLASLDEGLATNGAAVVVQAQAVYGLGGVGKTHLALENAYRHQSDFDVVWWITAHEPTAIPEQLVALARRLGIPDQVEQVETIGVLRDELRRHRRWLLIFDNAERPQDLRPYLDPGRGGRILITSRNPAWGGVAASVQVDVLARAEAVAFLRQRAGLEQPTAYALADALGDLPLALEQAAAYLEQSGISPDEYLVLLRDRGRELLQLGEPATTEWTIATTWTTSIERIRAEVPAAEDLLTLCAFLAPDHIPLALLSEHSDELPDRLAATVRDRLSFRQALSALRRYSLITVTDDAVGVHRLVQAVVRRALDSDGEQQWARVAVRLLRAAFPTDADDVEAWQDGALLLPHGLAIAQDPIAQAVEPEMTADLLGGIARYLWGRGEFRQAKTLVEQELALRVAHTSPDDSTVAFTHNSLGVLLHSLGDLDMARIHYEQALSIYEASLGPNHAASASGLANLGNLFRDLGQLDAARSYHERALAIREAHGEPADLKIAESLNSLANVLRDRGELDTARTYHEKALALREARLGPDHPTTAQSLSNLASVLQDLGDPNAARVLYERALAIREARLGPDHPTTALSGSNLATALQALGDLEAARVLFERTREIFETRLGPNHPDTAHSLNNLANLLQALGDLEAALTYHERALAIYETRLGPEHPFAVRSRQNLAGVMAALRKRANSRLNED